MKLLKQKNLKNNSVLNLKMCYEQSNVYLRAKYYKTSFTSYLYFTIKKEKYFGFFYFLLKLCGIIIIFSFC